MCVRVHARTSMHVHMHVSARAHMHVHGELWLVEEGIPIEYLTRKDIEKWENTGVHWELTKFSLHTWSMKEHMDKKSRSCLPVLNSRYY